MNGSIVDFFLQAEDGIRDLVRSRGLGDVYKRQVPYRPAHGGQRRAGLPLPSQGNRAPPGGGSWGGADRRGPLLYKTITLPPGETWGVSGGGLHL